LIALAQALLDHSERPLNRQEIDMVIAKTLAREAPAAERRPPRALPPDHGERCERSQMRPMINQTLKSNLMALADC
jgi:hypothetical protein